METSNFPVISDFVQHPDDSIAVGDGISLVWNGETALIQFDDAGDLSDIRDSTLLVSSEAFLSALSIPLLAQKIQGFKSSWFAWTNHPGRFGGQAITSLNRSLPAGEITWTNSAYANMDNEVCFGRPTMRFRNDAWLVFVEGFGGTLQQVPWDDREQIEHVVSLLGDGDYWNSIAALSFPDGWRQAQKAEEERQRRARRQAERAQENEAAARSFQSPDLAVSTRKLARLLRNFPWGETVSRASVDEVKMLHCDLVVDGGQTRRIAECLIVGSLERLDIAVLRELRTRLESYLAQHGYFAILARSGRIYIARDERPLKSHLPAVARLLKESPGINIW